MDQEPNLVDLPEPPKHHYEADKPAKTRRSGSRWRLDLLLLLLAGVIFLAGWLMVFKTAHNPSVRSYSSPGPKPTSVLPASRLSTHNAAGFGVSFSYPKGWHVVDSGSAPLFVYSPPMQLTAADGSSVTGQVVEHIAAASALPSGFTSQSVAVDVSRRITFAHPAAGQAFTTYISYVQYPSTTTVGGLNAVFLSGNYGYQKGQDIPASQIVKVSPLFWVDFNRCGDPNCSPANAKPLVVKDSSLRSQALLLPINSFFSSIHFDS